METKFTALLTTENYLEEVGKYVDVINDLATKHGVSDQVVVLNANVITFNDGGKATDTATETSKKFNDVDLSESASHGPETIAFMVNNVALYGLRSHDLYKHIMVGGAGANIVVGAN